jgi:NAD(P)-dependent dehydrogenase (short-subunit alcohol dehydrogenase family)
VYLITGGAGGLGLSIARQAAGATLVLVGRSAPTEHIREKLRELDGLGALGALSCGGHCGSRRGGSAGGADHRGAWSYGKWEVVRRLAMLSRKIASKVRPTIPSLYRL